ncbi:hypothetical protein AB0O80_10670 [Rothia kristinae]|uniref:hypothetical protein n=1 Tax=Actinomycetes TaxID=1760 RepID=UPI00344568DF
MARKRNRRGIWPVHLPRIRAQQVQALLEIYDPDARHDPMITALRGGDLWWVSAPMAALAYAAAGDLPEDQQIEMTRPTLGGVLIWEGGTGLSLTFDDAPREHWTGAAFGAPRPPAVDIIGALWTTGPGGPLLFGLTDDPRFTTTSREDLVAVYPLDTERPRLEALLISTWLLADQPTIGTRRRWDPRTPGMHARRIPHDSEVQIIKLRESLTHPDPWPAEATDTPEERRWQLTHRILVSGHWRQQPCGPGREDHRPIFVPPHIKGPAGSPLVLKPKVKVWSR